ncbi:MAG: hypothetical protein KZQ59_04125 [Candidatus Thiodiazotropha sp. (ex Lucinoma aequizonata)]|nr:hypothetical protein [Candidatus Thiodiazotropha sp. (ex Lucinoma aequizonata)]MCU7896513.1 hypothetical protein [Candidatus Thiodiazotropha sp. (ex Lucinoma aequizonata)]
MTPKESLWRRRPCWVLSLDWSALLAWRALVHQNSSAATNGIVIFFRGPNADNSPKSSGRRTQWLKRLSELSDTHQLTIADRHGKRSEGG